MGGIYKKMFYLHGVLFSVGESRHLLARHQEGPVAELDVGESARAVAHRRHHFPALVHVLGDALHIRVFGEVPGIEMKKASE